MNTTRKGFIADYIIKRKPKVVGIYRLVMESGSDNFRASAIPGVLKRIKARGVEVVVYESTISDSNYFDSRVIKDLSAFKQMSDVIVANRPSEELIYVMCKVYSIDIFGND